MLSEELLAALHTLDRGDKLRVVQLLMNELAEAKESSSGPATLMDAADPEAQADGPQLVDHKGVLVVQSQAIAELADVARHERDRRLADLIARVGI